MVGDSKLKYSILRFSVLNIKICTYMSCGSYFTVSGVRNAEVDETGNDTTPFNHRFLAVAC